MRIIAKLCKRSEIILYSSKNVIKVEINMKDKKQLSDKKRNGMSFTKSGVKLDLLPNLVKAVKAYAKHEKELLTEITALRSDADKLLNENKSSPNEL